MLTNILNLRMVFATAWICIGLNIVLMAIRGYWAISFNEPLFTVTSGAEEDSLLAFWKFMEGRSVFEDPHRFPFVASAYNWLYYASYGLIAKIILSLLSLELTWIPTIGRLISLAWAAIGALSAFFTLRWVCREGALPVSFTLPFAIFLFFGPLVGFWAIASNVEIAATVMGILAAFVFITQYDRHPVRATVLACVFSYAAWSFKQSHIFLPLTLGVFLLARRDWRGLAIVSIAHGAGWGLALLGGSEAYVKMMLFKGTDATLELSRFIRNFTNFALKVTPIAALVAVCAIVARKVRLTASEIFDDTPAFFAFCGVAISAAITLPFSAKQGASENYYFPLTFFLVFAACAVFARIGPREGLTKALCALLIAGWAVSAAASGSVVFGFNGVLSVRHYHDKHTAQARCVADVPGPVLPQGNLYLSLPWMTAAEPRFNIFFNYAYDRRAGRWFERDGVGGLIKERYFKTILLGAGSSPLVDGVKLDEGYRLDKANCAGLDIYARKDAN